LTEIEYSAFVVCLDSASPATDEEFGKMILCGDPHNRWFDKVVQVVVFANGRAGVQGQHTPLDASPVSEMVDRVLVPLNKESLSQFNLKTKPGLPEPQKLQWKLSEKILKIMKTSMEEYGKLADNVDLQVLHFKGYGSKWLKEQKISPDSFFQMILQLAYYRIHKKPPPTYETAMTRQFHHGRTETCRSCSQESFEFIKSVDNNDLSAQDKINLLKKAIESHKKFMIDAINGKGCDRHLLGLRIFAMEELKEGKRSKMPDIFLDPAYSASNSWKLSTSTIPTISYTPGFTAVVEDGYGICYNPRENEVRMAINSWKSAKTTSSKRLKEEIEKAFIDVQNLFKVAPQSKL